MADPSVTKSESTKLEQLATTENEVLYQLKCVFPFDLFPDVITIYRNEVSVIRNNFFHILYYSSTLPITNINDVHVNMAFPFASLEISNRFRSEKTLIINNLLPKEAEKAKKIIEGLQLAVTQHIDVSKIPRHILLRDLLK